MTIWPTLHHRQSNHTRFQPRRKGYQCSPRCRCSQSFLVLIILSILAAITMGPNGARDVYASSPAALSTMHCPKRCDCKWKDGKESVSCVNQNLTAIPAHLNSAVLVFNFEGNSLKKLTDDVFERCGLVNLQKLFLARCNIGTIERYAFRSLKNLVELDLSENVLTVIPSQAFAPIHELRELRMNGNPILKVASYAFSNVHKLVRLELSHCRIGSIYEYAFTSLDDTLQSLSLNGNRLTQLSAHNFVALRVLHAFDISANPLNCSCALKPLRQWISSRSLTVGTMPTCGLSPAGRHVQGKSWDHLGEDDFACTPSVQATVERLTAVEGENVTLSCRVHGSPSPSVNWWLRDRPLLGSGGPSSVPALSSTLISEDVVFQPHHVNTSTFFSAVSSSYVQHARSPTYTNLTILAVRIEDRGNYTCVAQNKAGMVTDVVALTVDRLPVGTILSEKIVLFGILITAILIVCICSIIVFIRVMYCKHDTQADIESKRRILSQKIEMKRNSANLKRSSSILPARATIDALARINGVGAPFGTFENCKVDKPDKFNSKLNCIVEENSGNRIKPPDRPNRLIKKSKCDNSGGGTPAETSQSPSSSIFESHIGEIALQHHVLHKKQLPSGNKLYTTAMAFMTDDALDYDNSGGAGAVGDPNRRPNTADDTNPPSNSTTSSLKKNIMAAATSRYNTLPRNNTAANSDDMKYNDGNAFVGRKNPAHLSNYPGGVSGGVALGRGNQIMGQVGAAGLHDRRQQQQSFGMIDGVGAHNKNGKYYTVGGGNSFDSINSHLPASRLVPPAPPTTALSSHGQPHLNMQQQQQQQYRIPAPAPEVDRYSSYIPNSVPPSADYSSLKRTKVAPAANVTARQYWPETALPASAVASTTDRGRRYAELENLGANKYWFNENVDVAAPTTHFPQNPPPLMPRSRATQLAASYGVPRLDDAPFTSLSYPHLDSMAAAAAASTASDPSYEYHSVQLERFLDEYRKLQSHLMRMKQTCEKYDPPNIAGAASFDSDYLMAQQQQPPLVPPPSDDAAFRMLSGPPSSMYADFQNGDGSGTWTNCSRRAFISGRGRGLSNNRAPLQHYGTNSFDRRRYRSGYTSAEVDGGAMGLGFSGGSLNRHTTRLPSRSRSFERASSLQGSSKNGSMERSVSFVPSVVQKSAASSLRASTSDDVIVPKSILKKRQDTVASAGANSTTSPSMSYYCNGTNMAAAVKNQPQHVTIKTGGPGATQTASKSPGEYASSTMPTKRVRIRSFSGSSTIERYEV